MINVWALWMAKEPCNIWIWFPAFRAKVNEACRYCRDGLSDEDVIRRIRYTREDAASASACNDYADDYFTE
jgi:hypothetical protein